MLNYFVVNINRGGWKIKIYNYCFPQHFPVTSYAPNSLLDSWQLISMQKIPCYYGIRGSITG
jgi:hypothetical protein